MIKFLLRIFLICAVLHALNYYNVISIAAPYSDYLRQAFYMWAYLLGALAAVYLIFVLGMWFINSKGDVIERWVNNAGTSALSHNVEAKSWQEKVFRRVLIWYALRDFNKPK